MRGRRHGVPRRGSMRAARLRRAAVDPHRVPNLGGQLGLRLLLKREDLNHTGSHKINNVLGQALLAKRMGKTRLVAETGAGQHGVATATARRCSGWSARSTWAPSTWPAGTQRVPDAPARRRGRGRRQRQSHAQGRGQRGPAGLGGDGRRHALLHRLGDGSAPVPVDGARAAAGRSATRPRAVPGAARRRSRRRRRLRRRRVQRRGSSPASSTARPVSSASSRRAAPRSAAASPASSTACAAT